MIQENY